MTTVTHIADMLDRTRNNAIDVGHKAHGLGELAGDAGGLLLKNAADVTDPVIRARVSEIAVSFGQTGLAANTAAPLEPVPPATRPEGRPQAGRLRGLDHPAV